ncbi:MAG: NAD(P)-binding domain-containing protein, partial [Pseudomonadota bacterium]
MTALLLVGGGRMGRALAVGWAASHDVDLTVVEPNAEAAAAFAKDVPAARLLSDPPSASGFDAIVFAVKPQAAAA